MTAEVMAEEVVVEEAVAAEEGTPNESFISIISST